MKHFSVEGRYKGHVELAEYRVPASFLGDPYFAQAELVTTRRPDLTAQCPGHDLGSQANTKHGLARSHSAAKKLTFRVKGWIAVVGRLRATDGDMIRSVSSSGGGIEFVESGCAFEDVEGVELEAALLEDRGVVPGQGLGGGVTNYQS